MTIPKEANTATMAELKPTQDDRDRFADYLESHGRPVSAAEARAGKMDDNDGILMLAAHRLASQPSPDVESGRQGFPSECRSRQQVRTAPRIHGSDD